jgi:RNA polymerase sigma-70 factor (ECF subfamily)
MPTRESLTVHDLLAQARGGDRQALDRLFAACRNYVRVLAQSEVASWLQAKVDPSDLVQQTLLDAYRDFRQFRGGTTAEWLVWLRRILEHNARDQVRCYRGTDKRQAAREVPLAGPAGFPLDPAAGGETPSQELVRKERELQVADALARLSDDHRTVLLLRNLQRLPFDEVARHMGRSRPAVQMLWLRAVRRLQEEAERERS